MFVVGQKVPRVREIDQYEDKCIYLLAYLDKVAVGTIRWRLEDDTAIVERLAVMEDARGQGVAQALTLSVMDDICDNSKAKKIKVGAQSYLIPFYQKFGFESIGDEYLEAGTIPHQDMVKKIN